MSIGNVTSSRCLQKCCKISLVVVLIIISSHHHLHVFAL
jgi:hypothetical protein